MPDGSKPFLDAEPSITIPTDYNERDRIRLEQELERELNDLSFDDLPRTEDHTGTTDFRADRVTPNSKFEFFDKTPDSRSLSKHFKDFSMGPSEFTDNSIEIGLGKSLGTTGVGSLDFSARNARSASGQPLVSERDLASRLRSPASNSSISTDFRDIGGNTENRHSPIGANKDKSYEWKSQKIVETPQNKRTKQIEPNSGQSRIIDALQRIADDSADYDAGAERPRSSNDKRFASAKSPALARLKKSHGVQNRTDYQQRSKSDNELIKRQLDNHPSTSAPHAFKSTNALLRELGLDKNTNAYRRPEHSTNPTGTYPMTQSFRIPNLPDMSNLMTDVGHRSSQHNPISSIPISADDQAILLALRTLQDKVTYLESQNTSAHIRTQNLEAELRRTRDVLQAEQSRARELDEQLKKPRPDSALGSANEHADQLEELVEKQRMDHALERKKLENTIASLKAKIDLLERQMDADRVFTQNLGEERSEAIRALAQALSDIDNLKTENERLRQELETIRTMYKEKLLKERSKEAQDRVKNHVDKIRNTPKTTSTPRKVQIQDSSRRHADSGLEDTTRESFYDSEELARVQREIEAARNSRTSAKKKQSTSAASAPAPVKMVNKRIGTEPRKHKKTIEIQIDTKEKPKRRATIRKRRPVVIETEDEDESSVDSVYDEDSEEMEEDSESEEEVVVPVKGARKPKHKQSKWIDAVEYSEVPRPKSREYKISAPRRSGPKARVNAGVQKIIDNLARHNPSSCTICSRKHKHADEPIETDLDDTMLFPPRARINIEKDFIDEESIRPSMPPGVALTSVLTQLEDEFRHLKLQYHELIDTYESLDPGYGKRKRKAIADRLREVIEQLEAKADQIYALYDALEAVKDDPSQTPISRRQINRPSAPAGRPWLEV
ncbi:Spindle pole body protein ppc89 [Neolecta irregularis DAH-3]|uniref:Spindle pole body protein ppc89 n=1 Tax=Neolecta irregularis (strain DAH-3) TaxID=1198029 RepID=A0A1U7LQV3_NEOID|nr:Spindle pole body protein ppc89 [Neolecta irregularis DAH-3]|eukprot:OLL25008.1 Spindle pole body protein ppc89 [Neolecta irregularis DAH-3]